MADQLQWVACATSAKMLGISRQRIHALVREGKLSGQVIDGRLLVRTSSIHERIHLVNTRYFARRHKELGSTRPRGKKGKR